MQLTRNAKYFKIREESIITFIGPFIEWKAKKLCSDRAQYLFEQFFHWRRRTKYSFTYEATFKQPVKRMKISEVEYKLVVHVKRIKITK